MVQHQARKYGETKFGLNRFINGFSRLNYFEFSCIDLGKRPNALLWPMGYDSCSIIGFIFAGYLGMDKLYFNIDGRLIAERPEFYIALTTMILGSQFFVAGFLGEILVGQQKNTHRYTIVEHTEEKHDN